MSSSDEVQSKIFEILNNKPNGILISELAAALQITYTPVKMRLLILSNQGLVRIVRVKGGRLLVKLVEAP